MKSVPPKRIKLVGDLPAGAVYVGHYSKWGYLRKAAASKQAYLAALVRGQLPYSVAEVIRELRGKDLACECDEGDVCHGDILLQVANRK